MKEVKERLVRGEGAYFPISLRFTTNLAFQALPVQTMRTLPESEYPEYDEERSARGQLEAWKLG